MAAKDDEKKELWVGWTRDALGAYTEPDDIKTNDDLLDDMVDSATSYADAMLEEGVYVIGFSYPVVPQGKARIRTQVSAAHSRDDLAKAVAAFEAARSRLG